MRAWNDAKQALTAPRLLACVALVASAASTGCADNESELFIRQVNALDDACKASADVDSLGYSSGLLDGAVRYEYFAELLVGNQTVARGDSDALRTETSKVNIYEYDVRVLNAEGQVFEGAAFTAPATGFVDQMEGNTASYGLVGVVLIDGATGQALGQAATAAPQQVVAEVIVRGRTLGGNELESPPFAFPISVCAGCLVTFPEGVGTDKDRCGGEATEEADNTTVNCLPGQDIYGVDCTACRDFNAACNPPK